MPECDEESKPHCTGTKFADSHFIAKLAGKGATDQALPRHNTRVVCSGLESEVGRERGGKARHNAWSRCRDRRVLGVCFSRVVSCCSNVWLATSQGTIVGHCGQDTAVRKRYVKRLRNSANLYKKGEL